MTWDALSELPSFLTSSKSPWWSALLFIVAGGVLTFLGSYILEKRKAQTEQARFEREQKIRDRDNALDLVAQLDAHAIAHLHTMVEAWDMWGAEFPDHRSDDGTVEGWSPEAIQRYNVVSREAHRGIVPVHATAARLRVLSLDEIGPAVDNVASTAARLRPSMPEAGHLATIEALHDSLRILSVIVGEVLLERRKPKADMFDQAVRQLHQQRLIVGEKPGVKQVFIHESSESTILNVPREDLMLVPRACAFIASNYADEGKSSVVWVIELMDGSFDVYAVALRTEGKPVANLRYTHPFVEPNDDEAQGPTPFVQMTFDREGNMIILKGVRARSGVEVLEEQVVDKDDFDAVANAFNESLKPPDES